MNLDSVFYLLLFYFISDAGIYRNHLYYHNVRKIGQIQSGPAAIIDHAI